MIIEALSKEFFQQGNSSADVDGFLSSADTALSQYRSIKDHANS